MSSTHDPAALRKLRSRIQALRAKTIGNGCTQDEALAAAAKVAELLDRYDLSLTDVDWREAACERAVYETDRKKRMPIGDCVTAISRFCDCTVWREKTQAGQARYVFFGLAADVDAAVCLTGLIDDTLRSALGRFKTSRDYLRFRHQDRHLANASFTFGMTASIAERLDVMKAERDRANIGTGRDVAVVKTSIIDDELRRLGLSLRTSAGVSRTVSPDAYEAGEAAGTSVSLAPDLSTRARS